MVERKLGADPWGQAMAEVILAVHLLIILFFLIGFPAGLLWNHLGFRFFHAAGLALVTLLMVLGIPCPITVWEEGFRDASYGGSFIAAWLKRIIYLEWLDPAHVLILDLCFATLVFSSFFWYPVKKRGGRGKPD